MRGLAKVQQQCLLAATVQNIKKIALLMGRNEPNMPSSTLLMLTDAYTGQLKRYCDLLSDLNKST